MEKPEIYSAIGIESIEWEECTNAWFFKNRKSLVKKLYFSNPMLYSKVTNWVYEHRGEIEELSLQEQEEIMIKDGIITRADI